MTELFVVRQETVPVEHLRPGDRVVLPSASRVTVDRVDRYDDGRFVVRWWRPAMHGEPGHRGGKQHTDAVEDEWNGRYYGSLIPVEAGHCWTVDRG